MTTTAIIFMTTSMAVVTFYTVWFFIRVLKSPLSDFSEKETNRR